jgi:uncharacterized protein YcgI (DUF1989 family)
MAESGDDSTLAANIPSGSTWIVIPINQSQDQSPDESHEQTKTNRKMNHKMKHDEQDQSSHQTRRTRSNDSINQQQIKPTMTHKNCLSASNRDYQERQSI